jgi:hypothetical protein
LRFLQLTHNFSKHPEQPILYSLHSTLIGDAAMRLGGLLGILKKHYSDPNVAACATNGVIANNLDKRDFEHVAMVIAFRDAYMHGEIPDDPQQRFAAFRQDFDDKYSR